MFIHFVRQKLCCCCWLGISRDRETSKPGNIPILIIDIKISRNHIYIFRHRIQMEFHACGKFRCEFTWKVDSIDWFYWFNVRRAFILQIRLLTGQIESYFPIFHCNFFSLSICTVDTHLSAFKLVTSKCCFFLSAPFWTSRNRGKTTRKKLFTSMLVM